MPAQVANTTNYRFIKIPWNSYEKPMNLFSGPWILHFPIFVASLKPINFAWKLFHGSWKLFLGPWKVGDNLKLKLMGHENSGISEVKFNGSWNMNHSISWPMKLPWNLETDQTGISWVMKICFHGHEKYMNMSPNKI